MQKEEYLIKNACYSVTKYYLCKRNNKRSLSGRKQRLEVVRSFPNRYQFSCINKVTSLFSNRYIFIIILRCKRTAIATQKRRYRFSFVFSFTNCSGFACKLYLHLGIESIPFLNIQETFIYLLFCAFRHINTQFFKKLGCIFVAIFSCFFIPSYSFI